MVLSIQEGMRDSRAYNNRVNNADDLFPSSENTTRRQQA